jgi:putative Holliday junction resolvase
MSDRYRILALDYGTKRIGVALSDEGRMLASARGTIANDAKTLANISELIIKENVRTVILGIPMTLSNTESAMTKEVRVFETKLRAALANAEVITRDERLTSVMAGSNVASRGMKKSRREQKGLHDEEAARIILQEYLDSI